MLRNSFRNANNISRRCKSVQMKVAYQTTRGISASIASSIPFAASGGLSGHYFLLRSALAGRTGRRSPRRWHRSLSQHRSRWRKLVCPNAFRQPFWDSCLQPRLSLHQYQYYSISGHALEGTVIDCLLCVEALNASEISRRSSKATHVPCFPVKPWYITLVSLLMRRLVAVAAYGDAAVE